MGICCTNDPREGATQKEIRFADPSLSKDNAISEHASKRITDQQFAEDTEDDLLFKQNAVNIKSPKDDINVCLLYFFVVFVFIIKFIVTTLKISKLEKREDLIRIPPSRRII